MSRDSCECYSRTDCRFGARTGRDRCGSPYVVTPRIKKRSVSVALQTHENQSCRQADTWLRIKCPLRMEVLIRFSLCVCEAAQYGQTHVGHNSANFTVVGNINVYVQHYILVTKSEMDKTNKQRQKTINSFGPNGGNLL